MKADMWALGVIAVELALGCPPLSQLPPSNSMLFKKISGRFGFTDVHERNKYYEHKFSKEFQDMVIQCLDVDESKRPSIKILLDHDFFKNCTPSSDYLKLNLFQGLLSIEERFKNKELVECILNAQRLEFDLGPPLLLSKGSSDGGGEGISGRDGGGDNEIRKKILIHKDFNVQLKERISFLQEGKMDFNNLKHMLKTEEKN
ncbi:serine/threonine-protein kinase BLUS1 [Quercus suber]|uniref:Serine/threonine-protein kinase blus1 n=1 Tax=Quercus suber TaxID=58331 RepID=A0AAW0I4S5_QUESU|nr:serine/threonine-protein kinase BLUS1-like [Quercus suber]